MTAVGTTDVPDLFQYFKTPEFGLNALGMGLKYFGANKAAEDQRRAERMSMQQQIDYANQMNAYNQQLAAERGALDQQAHGMRQGYREDFMNMLSQMEGLAGRKQALGDERTASMLAALADAEIDAVAANAPAGRVSGKYGDLGSERDATNAAEAADVAGLLGTMAGYGAYDPYDSNLMTQQAINQALTEHQIGNMMAGFNPGYAPDPPQDIQIKPDSGGQWMSALGSILGGVANNYGTLFGGRR